MRSAFPPYSEQDDLADGLHPARHGAWEAVQRRLFREEGDELLGVVGGDDGWIEGSAEASGQFGGRPKCLFHGHLLVQHHAQEQRQRVLAEQRVGFLVARQMH